MCRFGIVVFLILAISLLLMTPALAMIDPPSDTTNDRWYTVDDEEKPFADGIYWYNDRINKGMFETRYYVNDQTFLTLAHSDNYTYLNGSYLWSSGFFVGLQFEDDEAFDEKTWGISPGYRWNLDRGYLAFGVDFIQSDKTFYDMTQKGMDLMWLYYPENMKLRTRLQWMKIDDDVQETTFFGFLQSFNYKLIDGLVVGINYWYASIDHSSLYSDGWNDYYALGFTWDPKFCILNGSIGTGKGQSGEDLRTKLVIPFADSFQLELEYYRWYESENQKRIGIEYRFMENASLALRYAPDYDEWMLVFHQDL